MAWNDLTIAQRSQMMNLMRHNGISTLSEMKRIYDNAFSSIVERPDPYLQHVQAPVYEKGGGKNLLYTGGDADGKSEPTQWKRYNGEAVTLERYKELQRQAIIDAAVQKALTRTTGIAPIVDGIPRASCLYTATDNFGPKYRVAYNPELMAHPEKYGWEVAGPLTDNMLGHLYIMRNNKGVWDHGNLITGYDDKGNALISYSQGHAGGKPAPTREEWEEVAKTQRAFNGVAESYEDYVARMAKINSPEADYKRNKRIWDTPGYETLRFIGTPDDNARWEEEFNSLEGYNTEKLKPRILNNEVRLLEFGGPEKENFQVRDNTRVNSIAPQQTGYIPAMDRPLPKDLGEARWDSGVSGVLPFVGDGLQALQAVRDFKSHDWVTGFQTAGLLFAPNIIEKPLKGLFSSSLKGTKSAFNDELFKMIEQDAYRDVLAGRMPAIPVPKENLGKVMAMPEDVKRVLWNSTLPRLKATHTDVDVDALWNKAMGRATYTEYPAETYAKAGEGWAAGHYNPDTGNIGMKEGSPHMAVLPHEGRHRLDAKIPLTEEESGILNDAFGQEFLDLPNTVPELKGYNSILRDEVTTNADARMKLLGEMHSQRTPPELQNKIIAKKTDEQVVKAIEESNFYGRKLIENLRASGKLTPERINKFRIAMQKVGAVAGVGYLGNYLYNTDEEPANPIGFGVLQPEEFASGGHKIHIKKANRGKFTALKKRTGHSASWFKAHGTPAQKKMATFALNAKKWRHKDGGFINTFDQGGPYGTRLVPMGGDFLEYLMTTPEVYGGTIEPPVVTAELPAKFNGSQETARRYAEGYLKGAKPVTNAIDNAGRNIFKTADTVAGFIPGPIGAIDWVGHLGADVANGNYGKAAKDVAFAVALGAGAKVAGKGLEALKNSWDEIGNFGADTFRAFTDPVPGTISTNFTYEIPEPSITDQIYRVLGRRPSEHGIGRTLTDETIEELKKIGLFKKKHQVIYDSLVNAGVDVSNITYNDLVKLYDTRLESIGNYAGQINEIYPGVDHYRGTTHPAYNIVGYTDGSPIGFMEMYDSRPFDPMSRGFHIDMVKNISGTDDLVHVSGKELNPSPTIERGVQRRLSDAAIRLAKEPEIGMEGLVSGEFLMSPERTVPMYKKYADKEVIGEGLYRWGLHDATKQDAHGPVYLLKSPTEISIPTKMFRYLEGFPFEFDSTRFIDGQYQILPEGIFKGNGGFIRKFDEGGDKTPSWMVKGSDYSMRRPLNIQKIIKKHGGIKF